MGKLEFKNTCGKGMSATTALAAATTVLAATVVAAAVVVTAMFLFCFKFLEFHRYLIIYIIVFHQHFSITGHSTQRHGKGTVIFVSFPPNQKYIKF